MKVRRSICGPLSVGFPLLGLGVIKAVTSLPDPEEHSSLILIVLVPFLLGIGFAIAGMVREEPLRWLPAIGFGFNIILIAVGFALS
jgi:hypothetical protein